MTYLSCDELIHCHGLFYQSKRDKAIIVLNYMDQGSMVNIILKSQQRYSENFCRYTLYNVALGLAKMHRANVLHRDIISDNILHSADGQIRISDLGLSDFLSQ